MAAKAVPAIRSGDIWETKMLMIGGLIGLLVMLLVFGLVGVAVYAGEQDLKRRREENE